MASSRDSSASFRRASVSKTVLETTFERFDADKGGLGLWRPAARTHAPVLATALLAVPTPPRAADGFMVLDEFYEAMQDLIAKKVFPDVVALTKDESDEIFLDVCWRPAPAAPSRCGVTAVPCARWQCDTDDDGQVSRAEFLSALGGDDDDGDA